MIDKMQDIVGQNSATREMSVPVQPFPEALMEACCRVFAACLDLSPPLVVRLINTLFESKHPLNSTVSAPSLPGLPDLSGIRDFSADDEEEEDEVDDESYLFSDYAVDLSVSILEERPWGRQGAILNAHEYLLEFQPEYRDDVRLPIADRAVRRGFCSESAAVSGAVRKPCATTICLRDVSGTEDMLHGDLIHAALRTGHGFLYLHPIKAVQLNQKRFEEIADDLLLLLPFEILRDYDVIRTAPAEQALKWYETRYESILRETAAQQARGILSPEDSETLLDCTSFLAKVAYGDRLSP